MSPPDEPPDPPAPSSAPDAPPAAAAVIEDVPAPASSASSASPADITPVDDPLAHAIRAIERGDHVEARRLALALRDDRDEKLRRRARALLDQLKLDPVILGVLGGTFALIMVLAVLYIAYRR